MFISVGLVVLIVPYSNVSPILRLPEKLVVGEGGKPYDSPLQQCVTYITTTRESCGVGGRQAMTVPYSKSSLICL
jgi:hypothetical protein